jgi:hypothetical protein
MSDPRDGPWPADQPAGDGDAVAPPGPEDVHDELPEDLDRGFVGAYTFPPNQRRRLQAVIYIVAGVVGVLLGVAGGSDAILVNSGLAVAGVGLILVGIYAAVAGVRMGLDENQALVVATRAVAMPVGHASAQLGWRGLLSRPTWRMLVYSADDPPSRRALVLIDGVDGTVIDQLVEENPEDWSTLES